MEQYFFYFLWGMESRNRVIFVGEDFVGGCAAGSGVLSMSKFDEGKIVEDYRKV